MTPAQRLARLGVMTREQLLDVLTILALRDRRG